MPKTPFLRIAETVGEFCVKKKQYLRNNCILIKHFTASSEKCKSLYSWVLPEVIILLAKTTRQNQTKDYLSTDFIVELTMRQ